MTNSNQTTLKEEIEELELLTRPVLQNMSPSNQEIAMSVSSAISNAMKIINKLQEVIEIQQNLLLAQHQLLQSNVEDAKKTIFHAIEKAKIILEGNAN